MTVWPEYLSYAFFNRIKASAILTSGTLRHDTTEKAKMKRSLQLYQLALFNPDGLTKTKEVATIMKLAGWETSEYKGSTSQRKKVDRRLAKAGLLFKKPKLSNKTGGTAVWQGVDHQHHLKKEGLVMEEMKKVYERTEVTASKALIQLSAP